MSCRMTSKERVLTAFEHEEPDHVPAWLGASPEFRELARNHLGLDDDERLSLTLGDDFRRGMDLEQLKAKFGDKIVLMGGIDSQMLIEGTPEQARIETRRVLEIMRPGGGYVASPSHDYLLPETPVENVIAMFETIREYGSYHPRGLEARVGYANRREA